LNASADIAGERVALRSSGGAIGYEDSLDHFENGLLRLMHLDREAFVRWLDLAERSGETDLLPQLRAGWRALRPLRQPAGVPGDGPVDPGPGGTPGRVWLPTIFETPEYGVGLSDEEQLAWLVRWDGERFARESEPPEYEEEYFEGDQLNAGGYGAYTEQAAWRLEKAHRQVREMREATGTSEGPVLDLGCGYGYFRVGLEEARFEHEGLEISEFARRVAKESYGFDTHAGVLEDHWENWTGRFQAITLFDVIEHVPDGVDFLTKLAHCLAPGGVAGIKTPNIECTEAEVFGSHYHSLKREHLLFFSPRSLTAAAERAGLELVEMTTPSHLLRGFVGDATIEEWQRAHRGADLAAWYRKPTG
jgi:2-polyprenyl-3-methyl-5-hydroxy-6-metoxy-1,4-benzoquinol methylase